MLVFNENRFRLKVNAYGGQGEGSPGGAGMSSPDVGGGMDTNYNSIQSDWEGINADILSPRSIGQALSGDSSPQSDWEGINTEISAPGGSWLGDAAKHFVNVLSGIVPGGVLANLFMKGTTGKWLGDMAKDYFGNLDLWGTAPPGPRLGSDLAGSGYGYDPEFGGTGTSDYNPNSESDESDIALSGGGYPVFGGGYATGAGGGRDGGGYDPQRTGGTRGDYERYQYKDVFRDDDLAQSLVFGEEEFTKSLF